MKQIIHTAAKDFTLTLLNSEIQFSHEKHLPKKWFTLDFKKGQDVRVSWCKVVQRDGQLLLVCRGGVAQSFPFPLDCLNEDI